MLDESGPVRPHQFCFLVLQVTPPPPVIRGDGGVPVSWNVLHLRAIFFFLSQLQDTKNTRLDANTS